MWSPHPPAAPPAPRPSRYDRPGPALQSTTTLLRAATAKLLTPVTGRAVARWMDRDAAWLELPPGWARVRVDELVVAMPRATPGGTTFLLLVEPVHEAPDGSADADFEPAASDPGFWFPAGAPVRHDDVDGWTFRIGAGVLALNGTSYVAVAAVARTTTLRARFWALADSEDTSERYRPAVLTAITSVRRFHEVPVGERVS